MNTRSGLYLMIILLMVLPIIYPGPASASMDQDLSVYFHVPEGGESWTGGSRQTIKWNLTFPSHISPSDITIRLDYLYDGRGPYSIAQLTGQTTNHTWTTPKLDYEEVMLMIRAESGTLRAFDIIYINIDSSPAVLTSHHPKDGDIIPSTDRVKLTFDQPVNTSDVLANFTLFQGTTQLNGFFQSVISEQNYSLVFHPFSTLEAGDDYRWSLQGGIKDTSQPGNMILVDISVEFTVEEGPPEVSVHSPISGYSIKTGETLEITWSVSDGNLDDEPVNISYSADRGNSWINIAKNIDNTGLYNWEVQRAPLVKYPLHDVQVRVSVRSISGHEGYGYSDLFSIYDNYPPEIEVIRPYRDSYLVKGHTYNIIWEATDDNPLPHRPITISISTDGGESWRVIAQSIRNTGEHSWRVEGIPAGEAMINISVTDSHGAVSWARTPTFIVLSESPLRLNMYPVKDFYHSREMVEISWNMPPVYSRTQRLRLLYSIDGESWIVFRDLDTEDNSTTLPMPFEMSSSFRFRIELYDWEEILFYNDSDEFEVFPEILSTNLEHIDDFTFITIRFDGYVSLRSMQQSFTLYRDNKKIDMPQERVYSLHSSIIVFIVNDLEPGDYRVVLNSDEVVNRDFSPVDVTSFTIEGDGTPGELWALLLLIPLAVVMIYMYRGKGKIPKKVEKDSVKIFR